MNSTPETSQQPTQTNRNEALRVLQKCHAGDIDDFLSEIRQKKTTDEPSTTMSNTPETDAQPIKFVRETKFNGLEEEMIAYVPKSAMARMERARKDLMRAAADCALENMRLERERNAARRELQLLLESTKVKTCSEPQPETDTPETDAFIEMGHGRAYSEFVDLCRRLERERDKFKKYYLDMKRERDNLIDQRDFAITLHKRSMRRTQDMSSFMKSKQSKLKRS